MSTFLPSLYKEFQDLSTKLFKISDLILEYGGELPEKDTTHYQALQDSIVKDSETDSSVPTLQDTTSGVPQQSDENPKITNSITALKSAESIAVANPIQTGFDYPQNGSWKDKIIYALRFGGKPCLAKEIALYIQRFEPPDNANHVLSMVRQYTSTLSKAGKIGVDHTAHAHKYFLTT